MFGVRVSICIIPYLSESIQPWPLHVWHFNDIQQLDARLDESLRFSQCASQTLEVTSLLVGQTRWHLTDLTDVFSCVFFFVSFCFLLFSFVFVCFRLLLFVFVCFVFFSFASFVSFCFLLSSFIFFLRSPQWFQCLNAVNMVEAKSL